MRMSRAFVSMPLSAVRSEIKRLKRRREDRYPKWRWLGARRGRVGWGVGVEGGTVSKGPQHVAMRQRRLFSGYLLFVLFASVSSLSFLSTWSLYDLNSLHESLPSPNLVSHLCAANTTHAYYQPIWKLLPLSPLSTLPPHHMQILQVNREAHQQSSGHFFSISPISAGRVGRRLRQWDENAHPSVM